MARTPGTPRAVRWTRGAVGVLVFLLLAEAAGRLGLISRSALPLTSTVLARAVRLPGDTRFLADLGATLEAWAAGLAVTVVVAVPLGVVLGSLPGVRVAAMAVVEFLRPIPSVALILLVSLLIGPGLRMMVTLIVYGAIWPVLYNTIAGIDDVDPVALETHRAFGFSRLAAVRMVLFKIGTPMEVATIVFGTVWPILLNTIDGAASVDAVQLETAHAFRLTAWQRLSRLIVPAALPKILTGFRLSLSLALILMIFSEFVGSSDGIGYEMVNASNSFDMTMLWSAIVLLGILGYLLNALLGGAERMMLSWHRGVRTRS